MKTLKGVDKRYCEFDVELKYETDKALLVTDGIIEAWIPKSQLEDEHEHLDNGLIRIVIPEWLAQNKELT